MPVPQNYKKPGRVSAKSLVLNQLQDWIIEGVLQPDEKINDVELAEALGVSRTPVREALQILELSGLVEMVPGQKTKIAPIKLDDVSIIYETMAGLHSIIGKQALQRITETDIQQLSFINADFQQSINEKNSKRALELDIQFHNTITSIAKNPYIEPFLENTQLHVLRLEYLFFQNFVPASQSIEEHHSIIQALQKQDEKQMEQMMSQNWLRPMKEIQKMISTK
ncbi:GntR family transcriptional regulator [Bacillus paramycoides]|uniref:GntR family transcriptional regulator n=1 Tax=Bacillus paramycoides TaxID=2026194 RepID=A0A1J9U5E7_9BACI|nr:MULTISPECIES: GntR family transcriptional regulator [Bacillus cereus group]PGM67147.1 GntR family transcriptional regulator [Bacillus cereus]MED0962494.1 GntR family transcriptional regulator [Bacillus paramycoides]MED0968481.1 GntR family transcriptional regulator [Bacillus paramycoides]MED1104520.1 GntR family transcriptional regulator [Bacillus paramycoides]MED1567061.1 GntR family transcriptional regulator [Bacillus paramycoides]